MKNRTRNKMLEKTYRVYLIPIVMAVVILPLLVLYRQVENPLVGVGWGNDSPLMGDIFLCIKKEFIYVILGVLLFFMLCFWLLHRKIFVVPKYFVLLGGYLLLAILSSIAGVDSWTSWHGAIEMMQPIMVIVAYITLFYFTYIVICGETNRQEDMLRFLNRIFLVLALALSVIGILQILHYDYLDCQWVKKLLGMTSMQLKARARAILTLYHADYVGSMMVLLIPMCCAGAFHESSRVWRILYIVATIGNVVCLLGAQSRSGIIALLCSVFVVLLMRIIADKKRRMKMIVAMVGGAVVFCGIFLVVNQVQNQKLSKRVLNRTSIDADLSGFSSVETNKQEVRMEKNGNVLRATWYKEGDGYHFKLQDEAGKTLSYIEDKEVDLISQKKQTLAKAIVGTPIFRIDDERYQGIYLQANSYFSADKRYDGITFFCGNRGWFFTKQKGEYKYVNRMGRLDDCVATADAFPKSWYPFASYRGYAWSKTIPLLSNTLVWGAGPDTFEQFFPNNDYAAKAICDLDHVIYNRPHNWFLQMASETGVLSALLVFVFLLIYIVKMFRENAEEVHSNKDSSVSHTKAVLKYGCFAAIVAYLMISLANDSMVVVAPVFWTILGIGYALLQRPSINITKLKKNQKRC